MSASFYNHSPAEVTYARESYTKHTILNLEREETTFSALSYIFLPLSSRIPLQPLLFPFRDLHSEPLDEESSTEHLPIPQSQFYPEPIFHNPQWYVLSTNSLLSKNQRRGYKRQVVFPCGDSLPPHLERRMQRHEGSEVVER